MSKIWFITGASSGFGEEIAKQALQKGDKVVATFRKQEEVDAFNTANNPNGLAIQLDVTDQASINSGVQRALTEFGTIDYLINNAGYGSFGTIEETPDAAIRQQFEVNVFGLANITKAVLPTMRSNKSGHIFNFSSIAGLVSMPDFGYYAASKFAVEAISEALAQEVEPFGIQVTTIEPGGFKTAFVEKSNFNDLKATIPDYAPLHDDIKTMFAEKFAGDDLGDPVKLATVLVGLAGNGNAPRNLLLGADAYEWFFQKNDAFVENIKKWEKTTKSTALNTELDFDQAA